MKRNGFRRVGVTIVLCMTMIWAGCSTQWIAEAEKIVAALIPAVANLVALVAAFQGKGVSSSDMATIQSAGTQAGADLQLVQSLIAAYQKADAAAQPGILGQMQSAIGAAQGNLQGLEASVHIKDAATQAKVAAVVGIVLAEVESLAAVVPEVQGSGVRGQGSRTRTQALGTGDQGSGEFKIESQNPQPVAKRATKVERPLVPLSANAFVKSYNTILTAKTGNADVDQVAARLQIHLHGKVERVVTAGVLR